MAVSVVYSGKLADGKSIDELVSHVEEAARRDGLRTQRPEESFRRTTFKFKIPQKVIDNPDASHHAYSNRERIAQYAQEARLPTEGQDYAALCEALNSAEFRQVGVYLWAHEKAEPLKFLFVEGETELTELLLMPIGGIREKDPLHAVYFGRDNISTKTAYENDPMAHQKALDILRQVNDLYFDGNMVIKESS